MVWSAETRNSVRSVLTPRHKKTTSIIIFWFTSVWSSRNLLELFGLVSTSSTSRSLFNIMCVYFLRARLFTSLHKYTNVLTSQHSSKAINVNINNKVNWFALRFYSWDYVDLEWFCFLVNISNLFVFFRFQFYVIIFALPFHSNEELEWYEHRLKRFYCK